MPFDPLVLETTRSTKLLDVCHVAYQLGYRDEFVRLLIRKGKLKAIRVERQWRVRQRDVDAYLDTCPSNTKDHTTLPTPLAHVPLGDRRQILGGRRGRPREHEPPRRAGDVIR